MLKACFIVINYVSDDVFEDFRNWIILNGKENFYKTLDNPDFITDYISVDDPVEEVTGEPLLFVCEESWDGDIEELEKYYVYPTENKIDDDWPSKQDLEKEFPNLFVKFWDDENIEYNY